MSNKFNLVLVAASSIAVMTACTGKKGLGPVDGADANQGGAALGDSVESGASGFGPVDAGPSGFAAAVGASSSCVTLSGDVTDADADHIPANATLTYDCTGANLQVSEHVTGTENVVDDEPNLPSFAFHADVDLTTDFAALSGPDTASVHAVGSQTASHPGGSFKIAHSYDVTNTASDGTNTYHAEQSENLTYVYTPPQGWTPGMPMAAGTVNVDGAWDLQINNHEASSTVTTGGAGLDVSPLCLTRVIGGTVSAVWTGENHQRTLTVTWTGCGQRTVNYTEQ